MLIQLFSQADPRTVAEVAAHYRALGYVAETKCRRGVCYLRLWQDKPDDRCAPRAQGDV